MKAPNVLITGTPGCGKTTFCEKLKSLTNLRHIEVGALVRKHQCHTGRDEKFDSYMLDDDKLIEVLEPELEKGGNLVDFHTSYVFPEELIDLVVVLRTDNTVLYERLENRKYSAIKIRENIEAEIMQVCLDEARDNYDEEIIVELQNDTTEQLERNLKTVAEWITSHQSK